MRRKKLTREQATAWVLYFTEGYAANVERHIRIHVDVLERPVVSALRKSQRQAVDTAHELRGQLRKKR